MTPDRAVFDSPLSVRMDSRGVLIVADTGNCGIRNGRRKQCGSLGDRFERECGALTERGLDHQFGRSRSDAVRNGALDLVGGRLTFRLNEKQLVSAKYVDEEVYAGTEGAAPNVAMRAAKVGDRLVLTHAGVGVGSGPAAVVVRFGETDVTADIFAEAATGAHLLVVTMPEGLPGGEVALSFRADEVAGTQELWTVIDPATPAASSAASGARAGQRAKRAIER